MVTASQLRNLDLSGPRHDYNWKLLRDFVNGVIDTRFFPIEARSSNFRNGWHPMCVLAGLLGIDNISDMKGGPAGVVEAQYLNFGQSGSTPTLIYDWRYQVAIVESVNKFRARYKTRFRVRKAKPAEPRRLRSVDPDFLYVTESVSTEAGGFGWRDPRS